MEARRTITRRLYQPVSLANADDPEPLENRRRMAAKPTGGLMKRIEIRPRYF